ncbi:hypothetical protein Dda3937_02986 [Dickeya dadantii 3937]|uniref:Uncharacterized protein n=1 Tax=Dickeya dadantii (strain 3937) TaxID=198628 RepID=E0SJA8_DICD3|nr:hypothetical protein Dda3937_02986 [Dickeya dadantii 3937]
MWLQGNISNAGKSGQYPTTSLYAIAGALQIALTSYTPSKRKICVSRHPSHLPILESIDHRSFLHHFPMIIVPHPVTGDWHY